MERTSKILPFNLYDFYGYLIPGVLLIAGTFLIVTHFTMDVNDTIQKVIVFFNSLRISPSIVFFIVFISLVYFVGHINAMISHLIFDRTLVKRILGYPIMELLNIDTKLRNYSKATNYYFLFLVNLLIFIPILKLWLPSIINLQIVLITFSIIFIIIFLLRVVIFFSEKYFFADKIPVPTIDDVIRLRKLIKFVHKVYCWPFYIIDKTILSLIKEFLANDSKFDKSIVEKFKNKLNKDFDLVPEEIGTDNYWLPVIKITQSNEVLFKNLMNWLNLYSFLKNLSMVGFLLCLESGIFITLSSYGFPFNSEPVWESIIFGGLYIGSLLLMLRYWVIYRNYYTKYIIRAYIST